jgi:hypothetical protein
MASVAADVMAVMPEGVTARMVDYRIRTGRVDLDHRVRKGSGNYRWLHDDERRMLSVFASRWVMWREEGERFKSGAVWADIVNGSES